MDVLEVCLTGVVFFLVIGRAIPTMGNPLRSPNLSELEVALKRANRLLKDVSGKTVFTDEEVRSLETIANVRRAEVETLCERGRSLDSELQRRRSEVESAIRAREKVLNAPHLKDDVELFGVFQREHQMLYTELQGLDEGGKDDASSCHEEAPTFP